MRLVGSYVAADPTRLQRVRAPGKGSEVDAPLRANDTATEWDREGA
jgi:hypothetical protein